MTDNRKMRKNIVKQKIGISYCHSAKPIAEKICKRLEENGFEVIIDFKNLKYGHDINFFMEELTTRTGKVIILVDKVYADKADDRRGGVGSETFIISGVMYNQARPDRFIPCALEKDECGSFILPIYLQNRFIADFTSDEQIENNWGKVVAELSREEHGVNEINTLEDSMTTGRRFVSQLNADFSIRNAQDFFDDRRKYIDSLRIRKSVVIDSREFFEESIEIYQKLLPVRNQFIEFIYSMEKSPPDHIITFVHDFLMMTLDLKEPPIDKLTPDTINPHRHIAHAVFAYDVFLHSIATLIRLLKFAEIHAVLTEKFQPTNYESSMGSTKRCDYSAFLRINDGALKSQPEYKKYQVPGLHLVSENTTRNDIRFDTDICDADLIVFLHSLANSFYWIPMTILYNDHCGMPRTFFSKCSGKRNFKHLSEMVGIKTGDELRRIFRKSDVDNNIHTISGFSWTPEISHLINLEHLDTQI